IKKLLGGISNAIMEIVTSSQKSAASFESVGTKILQLDGLIKEVRDGMMEQNEGVSSISSTMQTLDSTTAEITTSSAHIKDAAKKLSASAQDLEKMAVETKEKSEEAKQNMTKMRESVHAVVQATGLSNDTSKKVSDMINRFKV
ncbi:MAG: methyl-accepting chemotaxis protein, partial [Treponema sp.]|nr:methyl-accepting chemotaxis protein [Treponema sp.]